MNDHISDISEFFKTLLQSFFIIVTLITAAMFFLGKIFQPDRLFGYEAYIYPIIYGFFSILPVAVMYSKKELSVKQLLIRKLLQLLFIIITIETVIFGTDILNMENIKTAAGICVSVIIIYLLSEVFSWFLSSQEAKKLTDELLAYQQNFKD